MRLDGRLRGTLAVAPCPPRPRSKISIYLWKRQVQERPLVGRHSARLVGSNCAERTRETDARVSEGSLFLRRLHAARALLSVEPWARLASRDLRRARRSGIHVDPVHARLLRTETEGHSLQLDVPLLRDVHHRVRRHAPHGGMDA